MFGSPVQPLVTAGTTARSPPEHPGSTWKAWRLQKNLHWLGSSHSSHIPNSKMRTCFSWTHSHMSSNNGFFRFTAFIIFLIWSIIKNPKKQKHSPVQGSKQESWAQRARWWPSSWFTHWKPALPAAPPISIPPASLCLCGFQLSSDLVWLHHCWVAVAINSNQRWEASESSFISANNRIRKNKCDI